MQYCHHHHHRHHNHHHHHLHHKYYPKCHHLMKRLQQLLALKGAIKAGQSHPIAASSYHNQHHHSHPYPHQLHHQHRNHQPISLIILLSMGRSPGAKPWEESNQGRLESHYSLPSIPHHTICTFNTMSTFNTTPYHMHATSCIFYHNIPYHTYFTISCPSSIPQYQATRPIFLDHISINR